MPRSLPDCLQPCRAPRGARRTMCRAHAHSAPLEAGWDRSLQRCVVACPRSVCLVGLIEPMTPVTFSQASKPDESKLRIQRLQRQQARFKELLRRLVFPKPRYLRTCGQDLHLPLRFTCLDREDPSPRLLQHGAQLQDFQSLDLELMLAPDTSPSDKQQSHDFAGGGCSRLGGTLFVFEYLKVLRLTHVMSECPRSFCGPRYLGGFFDSSCGLRLGNNGRQPALLAKRAYHDGDALLLFLRSFGGAICVSSAATGVAATDPPPTGISPSTIHHQWMGLLQDHNWLAKLRRSETNQPQKGPQAHLPKPAQENRARTQPRRKGGQSPSPEAASGRDEVPRSLSIDGPCYDLFRNR